ncbi:MAG: M42 family metallopeptidase [Firmicutes bacterium]|nr:M42 family metallopeptidase [Bacillota bacterium]
MLLERLTQAAGVSGNEDEVRRILRDEASKAGADVECDVLGNLIARKNPGETPRGELARPLVMLAAHMDEVGLIVSFIEKEGLLRFQKVGGIDDRVLPCKEVLVGRNRIRGVIGLKPLHLQESDEREKILKSDNLFIDIGARSREDAEKKVRPGDYASFAGGFRQLGGRTVRAKALDDRAGCAVLAQILGRDYPFSVVAVFTVQEEVGLRGAAVSAWAVQPDMAVVLEGTICSDTPGTDDHLQATRLGGGPALSIMDGTSIASKTMLRQMVEVATENNIPYQFKRITLGGNDAGRIHLSRTGVPTASVSVPCRYIHSPSCIMSLDDFENAIRLVDAFLVSVGEGFRP